MSQDVLGLKTMKSTLFIDLTLGIRHGADPDHLTVIDGLSRIEEKRRGVEALGAEMISKLTYLRALDSRVRQYPRSEGDPHP